MDYDKYIIAFSGGKDSIACFLYVHFVLGIPINKIELWHQDVDGQGETFMDWECTHAYCQAFANAFGVEIYFSWKEGGFKREMLRENSKTAPTSFITPDGEIVTVGGTVGKKSTRLKFPQVSPDLSVRWCSAYLKIDICATAIRNQERFNGLMVCVISGERGEESPARAKYATLERDRADLRNGKSKTRYVDRIRPIRDWTEFEIWEIIKRYRIRVHPCYYLGFSRCSCKFCIFGNANQFATANYISPKIGKELISHEDLFGVTLKRNTNLRNLIDSGEVYPATFEQQWLIDIATSQEYNLSILIPDSEEWKLPAGAFGDSCGPM